MTLSPGRAVRAHFLIDSDVVYLDHGSFGATPRRVLDVQDQWRRRLEQHPVRFMDHVLPGALRDAAAELARFVGAAADDLVFVDNATTGSNAVLRSLRLAPGDELLATEHVYGAVDKTMRFVAQASGARVVLVPMPSLDEADAPGRITDAVTRAMTPRTRIVVLDLITSTSALILPVAAIAAEARARGIPVLVDAAHAPGQIPLDVPALGASWVTGNLHKWLFAPKGTAFLWAAPDAQADLHPTVISHGHGHGFVREFDWVGTRDPSSWLCVDAALDFHRELGGERLMERNHDLALAGGAVLENALAVTPAAPAAMRAAMVTVELPRHGPATMAHARSLRERLWQEHRIEVAISAHGGKLWARVSAQAYNELDDYQRLAAILAAMDHRVTA